MTDHPLAGMWRLVSMQRLDVEGNSVEATIMTGLLMYTSEGWMSEALDYQLPGSELASTHVFYCGTYRVDGDTVMHQPLIHTNHDLVGQELPRHFEVEGDRFTLTAPNPNGTAVLVWERVRPQ